MSKNGRHGNSTHGIRAVDARLRKGERFDGYMQDMFVAALARRGLTPADLDGLGATGDVIRHTARLGVAADLVWGGLLMAGSMGDVGGFFSLLRDHGYRISQAIRELHREIELTRSQSGVYDYEQILAEQRRE